MKISSSKSPYLLQIERSNRPKATYGNRFRIELKSEKAESQSTETAEEEEEMNEVNTDDSFDLLPEEESSELPCYSITDEEAEYFLEKYGEKYDEDRAQELYYELADKGIISINDAARSSGTSVAMPLSAFNSITYLGGGDPYGLRKELNRDIGFVSDRVYIKDVSRTDKNSPYKILWDNFKKTYHREIETWEDALQETIDFERYVKDDVSHRDYVSQQHYSSVIENLEKTKDVISKIFGEVTL